MRVIAIQADNAGPFTGRGTNSYLIPGARPTLIDPAEPGEAYVERVAAALDEAQPGASLAQVLVTHAHPDHVSGVESVAARWPGARVAKFPWPERDAAFSVEWHSLKDEETLQAGDGTMWALHTPGHAPDHLAFLDVRTSIVFCGDLLVNGGTVAIAVSYGGDLAEYLRSLRRLLALGPRRIYPGHGPPVDNPGALIRGYIGHRLAREQQVVDELGRGPLQVEELVVRVYPELKDALRPAALETILAHLYKLRDEGRVVSELDTWRLSSSG
jgi:glyoxylase-like metal-dependent hydrolase (beta-lactamase superfamily II)